MNTVVAHKANAAVSTMEIGGCRIQIEKPFPYLNSMEEVKGLADADAQSIAKALADVLPQCTLERVIIRLMEARISNFIGRDV